MTSSVTLLEVGTRVK